MTRYAISEAGASAMKQLANNLLLAANDIIEASNVLNAQIASLGNGLGIYETQINDIACRNRQTLLGRRDEILDLAKRVSDQGENILSMINLSGSDLAGKSPLKPNLFASEVSTRLQYDVMMSGRAEYADFGALDDRTAYDIVSTIEETCQMFPELDLRFVGSLQARNDHLEQELTDLYMSVYKQHYPDLSEQDLSGIVYQHVAEDMRELIPSETTIAQSFVMEDSSDARTSTLARYNGITINEKYGSDYEYYKQQKNESVSSGWFPPGCDTPKSTVDHELGHQIAHLVNAHNDSYIQNLYMAFMGVDVARRKEVVSGYAAKDIHEFIAESWAEYRNNRNCRDCARAVSERMIDLYNAHNPVKTYPKRR